MAGQASSRGAQTILQRLLRDIVLPTIGFGVAVCYATKRYGLSSFATGLAMASALAALLALDVVLLQSRLKRLPQDWMRFGLENTFSLLEHILAPLVALFACGRVFGFPVEANVAWGALGGMVIAFPIVHGTSSAIRLHRQLREKERLGQQLQALATQAELKALKAQINPHFLFNTLNTIAQLIHTDPIQAEATVERLAEMFRYVLSGSERGLVTLEEELAFVNGYLEIERARFGERLRVTREVTPGALLVPVPSLILQPLVENAIRHGRGSDGSVDLTVRVRRHEVGVLIAIADRGPGIPPGYRVGSSPGHGLRNVHERLRRIYGEEYGLEIDSNEPRGAVVSIRIPIDKREP